MTETPNVKPVRLQKYLADCGICSRRQAEKYIEDGRVTVNGAIVILGTKVVASDTVAIDGEEIKSTQAEKVAYLVYKPRGVTSSVRDDHAGKLVTSLVPSKERLYPIGRLDRDSEGLIILTNDGDLTFKLSHPSFKISKKYHVYIAPELTDQDLSRIREGIVHNKEELLVDDIVQLGPNEATITLHHGKNRHIRRMFAALRLEVTQLIRTNIGPLSLADLGGKSYLRLTSEQIKLLLPRP